MPRIPYCRFYFALMVCLGLAGCGGSSMMPTPTPTPVPFSSGLYQISETSTFNPSTNFMVAGSLMQSGNSVSGVMHMTGVSCFPFNSDIPVTGTLGVNNTGDFTVALVLALPSGQTLSLSLIRPGGHLSFIDGTYTLTGAGCAATDQGNAGGGVLGVTGIWIGHFNSSGGVTSQINMTLNQTGPDANGFFSATGTATITGGTCFSTATVDPASVVIGSGSTLIFDNAQPGTTGKTTMQGDFAPLPFGGATFTGTYTSTQGTCSETGSVTMQIP
jgi:hypothetical protein